MIKVTTYLLNEVGGLFNDKTRKGGFLMDICISCGEELSIMERNRAECWECRDTTTEAYAEAE
jgi:hypothetical protein